MSYFNTGSISITTTAVAATYYTTGSISAPGTRNVLITGARLMIGSNAAPALGDFFGAATAAANANLFMFGANIANLVEEFTKPIILPAGGTIFVFSQGWAIGTVIDIICTGYII